MSEQIYMKCNSHTSKSSYPKDKIPIQMFMKNPNDPNSELYKNCLECRQIRQLREKNNRNSKKAALEEENKKLLDTQELIYKTCEYIKHSEKSINSKYPQDKVPISMFRKHPENVNSIIYKYCYDCRMYKNKTNKMINQRKKIIAENEIDKLKELDIDKEFNYCFHDIHGEICESIYPRNRVPINLFRKVPDNPKSELYKNCLDCRKYDANRHYIQRNIKKENAISNGNFYCKNCKNEKDLSNRALNLDGTSSTLCLICKEIEKQKSLEKVNNYKKVKLEMIIKSECSCVKCEKLYFQPLQVTEMILSIQTYTKENNERYLNYQNIEYKVSSFLEVNKHSLILDIIELDHLTEQEQRERGLLLQHEPFIKKKGNVCDLHKEKMRLESLKCQNVCAKCHIMETMKRETGLSYNHKSPLEKSKLEYVNELKKKGCFICKHIDNTIPRFFEFDHIDPLNKIENISIMVKESKYTMEDLINECNKCRILCRHCHRIHTNKQFNSGLIEYIIKSEQDNDEDDNIYDEDDDINDDDTDDNDNDDANSTSITSNSTIITSNSTIATNNIISNTTSTISNTASNMSISTVNNKN